MTTPEPPASLPHRNQLPRVQQRLDEDLQKLDDIASTLARQHTLTVLQSIAVRVARADSAATSFSIAQSPDLPSRWEIVSLYDQDAEELPLTDELQTELNQLLRSGALAPRHDVMPDAASSPLDPESWIVSLHSLQLDPAISSRSIIDINALTEDDYTRVHHAAREQLGLVGIVRTREDVREYLVEHADLRDDVTETQLEIATEVILSRYQNIQEQPHGGFEADSAVFADVVTEAADFLEISEDRSVSPGPPIYTPRRGLSAS
ncbi:hypothetical protein VVR84_14150 [Kocuria carniphila]|uniref:DUF222 domain-containing protein n=1 Tax=Kocuria carniphila TaxID=262208 RepID=A0ABV3V8H4_9MICC